MKSLEASGDRLSVELAEPEKNLPELIETVVKAGGKILEVTEEKHSLEEIYLGLVREEAK